MDPRRETQGLAARIKSSIRKSKCTWPNPEASTGAFVRMMDGKMCWQAVGPALDAFIRFSKDMEEHLDKFGDALPETVLRTPYMIGTRKEKLRPAVLFSSHDRDARRKAQESIEESGILQREGFVSMTCNRPPEFPTLMTLAMEETEKNVHRSSSTHRITLQLPAGMASGVRISISDIIGSRNTFATATGGGILEWNQRHFLMTACHPFQNNEENNLFIDDFHHDFEFDLDGNDFSDIDEDEVVDLSHGSKTSEEDGSDTLTSMSENFSSSSSTSIPARGLQSYPKATLAPAVLDTGASHASLASKYSSFPIHQLPSAPAANGDLDNDTLCFLEGPFASSIASQSPLLDYALVEITGHRPEIGNVPRLMDNEDVPLPEQNKTVDMNGACNIIALTASKGSIKGRLTGVPTFGTAPRSTKSQELWTVCLDGKLEKGDCGSWIVDGVTGAVYGQIIAGSPGTGTGLVAPLRHILNDLVRQFGGDWKVTSRSVWCSRSDRTSGPKQDSNKDSSNKTVSRPGLPSTNTPFRDTSSIYSDVATSMSDSSDIGPSSSLATSLSGSSITGSSSSLTTSMSGFNIMWSASFLALPTDLETTWLSLRDRKKRQIKGALSQAYNRVAVVDGPRSFRSAFENLCKKKRQYRIRLEAKLLPSYRPITELASAIDRSITDRQEKAVNDTLEGLVWDVSFTLIECGCGAGVQLEPLVALVAELNMSVPRFSIDRKHFTENKIQKPLKDIYGLFIDSHLFILSYLVERGPTSHGDPTKEPALRLYMDKSAELLQDAKRRFDLMVNHAAEDKERAEAHVVQPSLITERSLPDHLPRSSIPKPEIEARFVSIRFLGRGSYGDVEEVQELSTGAPYARKRIFLDPHRPPDVIENEVRNEVIIMQKLRHLHIATVLFYLKEENAYSIFMLPVADYDLRTFLYQCTEQDYVPYLTKQIYPWFGCLLDALAYAHKLHIKHQDIKPSNILIKHNQPYLSDFGLAKDFTNFEESTYRDRKVQGTLLYSAPEASPGGTRGRKADVFALGCVYSEMFTVTQGKSMNEFRDARQEAGSMAFRACLPKVETWLRSFESNRLNDLLIDQILSMMSKDTVERPSAEQALNFLKRERALFCVE